MSFYNLFTGVLLLIIGVDFVFVCGCHSPQQQAPAAPPVINSIGMKFRLVEFTHPKEIDMQDWHQGELDIRRDGNGNFHMGIGEVSQAEFEKLMSGHKNHGWNEGSNMPASVTWEQATEFCRKLSKLAPEKRTGGFTACRPKRSGNMWPLRTATIR